MMWWTRFQKYLKLLLVYYLISGLFTTENTAEALLPLEDDARSDRALTTKPPEIRYSKNWLPIIVDLDRPTCSSDLSPGGGSVITGSESITIRCQCPYTSPPLQVCPKWMFEKGEEEFFIDEQGYFDATPESCSFTFKFKLRPNLRIGKRLVEISCMLPGISEPMVSYSVIIDSPYPDIPGGRARLNIYLILVIIAFILITCSLLGFFFNWQIKSRRRAQRTTQFLNSFAYQQPGHQLPFTPAAPPCFQYDKPPSYNDATSPQSVANSRVPLIATGCIVGDLTAQEKTEAMTKLEKPVEGQTKFQHKVSSPGSEQINLEQLIIPVQKSV